MKKTGNKIISAILAGMMLVGSVPQAGAAYEEYLPNIKEFFITKDEELTKCIISYEGGKDPIIGENTYERIESIIRMGGSSGFLEFLFLAQDIMT